MHPPAVRTGETNMTTVTDRRLLDGQRDSLHALNATTAPQWRQHAFRAMNTDVTLELYTRQRALLTYVEHMFASFERRLSRFDPNSELSRLNRCAGSACQVSAELFAALEMALRAAQMTNGLYDPTILPALTAAGYDRTFEALADKASYEWLAEAEAPENGAEQSWTPVASPLASVRLDRLPLTVTRPPAVQFDLGGMGKGWTVDRAADLLYTEGPFLLNAGGDLYAHGYPGNEEGWLVELTHPLLPEQWFARVALANRALATSTIAKRRWRKHGQIMHHLIDPRTGQPARTDALSVTVVADRTVLAEIYAKTALVLGVEAGMSFLHQTPNVEACIFTSEGRMVYSRGFAPLLVECNATTLAQVWCADQALPTTPSQEKLNYV